MSKSAVVYRGDELLGEVEIYAQDEVVVEGETKNSNSFNLRNNKNRVLIDETLVSGKEIRITNFSPTSERCPPLAVLHTISSTGILFKMQPRNPLTQQTPLHFLHNTLIQDNKTAVMRVGLNELHLVALHSRNGGQCPCFWGFLVAVGLYESGLTMLNLRCLGIVFDLDETLVVANTMRSFEDRIEGLQRKISTEVDPQRVSGMLAEVKRYQDDKSILKQYVENDQVIDNGKVIRTQSEIVPPASDSHQPIVRPLIRLQEKNIILTRINPQIRDTSVLVRLRPAWEDLRSYLTARGRKRFEVYVCTMAERDYALEMWRLLDPESNLISSKELLDRIVCVKAGLRKALFNVFQDGTCHPKMALVIDDRLKVWDDKDQPRVHVVPAFAPYYAPQAEANNAIPVLCVARNVACNVRGGFFKEFDEGLLQKIPEISYEDNLLDIPSPPDVSNYLVSEDDTSTSSGNRDPPFDGMADAEVERRMKEAASTSSVLPPAAPIIDPRLVSSLQYTMASSSSSIAMPISQSLVVPFSNVQFPQAPPLSKPLGQVGLPDPSFSGSPAREEGEVPESELDPDTRRRLLILQHGQDTRDVPPSEPPFPVRPQVPVPPPRVQSQSRGSWVPVEEEMSPRQMNRSLPREFPPEQEPMHIEKHRPHHPSFFQKVDSSIPPDRMVHDNQRLPKESQVPYRNDRPRLNQPWSNYPPFSGEAVPFSRSSSNRDLDFESDRPVSNADSSVGVLQDIAMQCRLKLEFRPSLVASRDLQFSTEVLFAGDKVGEGIGRTRREAQREAADGSLRSLANVYISRDTGRYYGPNDNGFSGNPSSFGDQPKDDTVPFSHMDPRLEGSKHLTGPVTALKEFCMMEGLGMRFLPEAPVNSFQKDEIHAQVEVDGQVMGRGIGSSWDEARMLAADRALGSLRTMFGGQSTQKRHGSPRSMHGMSSKRMKPDFPRMMQHQQQRMPPSARYPKNASAVP
ncbi:RNA polymerase II C-terminal domain phosphatase-like 1 [Linum perenne]